MNIKRKLVLPIAIIVGSTPLFSSVACRKNVEPKVNDFQSDSWSTICYYANKGLDALKNAYKNTKSYHDNNDSFVGMQRTLLVNNTPHKVRVVGLNKDSYLVHGQTSSQLTKAALTFQFTTAVCWDEQPGSALYQYWGRESSNYWGSYIKHALNSPSEDILWYDKVGDTPKLDKGIYGLIIDNDTENWTQNIKPIYCSVNCRRGSPDWQILKQSQHIYLPTIRSLMSDVGIRNTISDVDFIPDQYKDLYMEEGQSQYDYYALDNVIGDKTMNDGEQRRAFDCLVLCDLSHNEPLKQWFQSPVLNYNAPGCVWSTYTAEHGASIYQMTPHQAPAVIAPCFSI